MAIDCVIGTFSGRQEPPEQGFSSKGSLWFMPRSGLDEGWRGPVRDQARSWTVRSSC